MKFPSKDNIKHSPFPLTTPPISAVLKKTHKDAPESGMFGIALNQGRHQGSYTPEVLYSKESSFLFIREKVLTERRADTESLLLDSEHCIVG